MKYRLLLALPLAWAVAFVLVYAASQGAPWRAAFLRTEIETVKALSLAGCLLAAFSFRRGDHLRAAWLLMGSCSGILLLRDFTLIPWFEPIAHLEIFRGAMVLLSNLLMVAGMIVFARTARKSGLALPGTAGLRAGALGLALVVSLLLAGPPLLIGARQTFSGDAKGMVSFASSLGDLVSFVLLAPVLFTALSLRGSLAGRPWWLLVLGLLCWMLYDATFALNYVFDVSENLLKPSGEFFRSLAFMFEFSAGLAQRDVLRKITHGR